MINLTLGQRDLLIAFASVLMLAIVMFVIGFEYGHQRTALASPHAIASVSEPDQVMQNEEITTPVESETDEVIELFIDEDALAVVSDSQIPESTEFVIEDNEPELLIEVQPTTEYVRYEAQAGAFEDYYRALTLQDRLKILGYSPYVVFSFNEHNTPIYRVILKEFSDKLSGQTYVFQAEQDLDFDIYLKAVQTEGKTITSML